MLHRHESIFQGAGALKSWKDRITHPSSVAPARRASGSRACSSISTNWILRCGLGQNVQSGGCATLNFPLLTARRQAIAVASGCKSKNASGPAAGFER